MKASGDGSTKSLSIISHFHIGIIVYALVIILLTQSVFSLLTTTSTIRNSGRIDYSSPLYVEGRYLKDAQGNIIYLRGIGKIHWDDDPTGWWWPQNGAWYQGIYQWNEESVRYHLRQMKSWGFNVVRFHTVADWWLQDIVTLEGYTGSYRNNLKRTIEIAAEEGLYVMMDLFSPVNGSWLYTNDKWPATIPFGPYAYAEAAAVLPNKQAFVDYWANVANELKAYPNLIFELYNEPYVPEGFDVATARDDWFDAMQKAITAIRNTGAENVIVVTWGLACVPHMGWQDRANVNLGYVEQYPLNDTKNNLVYTAHLYRTYLNPIWSTSYNYTDCYVKMEETKIRYVIENLSKPVIIGEIGADMWADNTTRDSSGLTALEKELAWARNVLNISNQWGIGYLAWDWTITDRWHVISLNGLPAPSAWGQILIDAVAEGGTLRSP